MSQCDLTNVDAVVFDKDGTVVDFHRTWDPVIRRLLLDLADGDRPKFRGAAAAIGYDLTNDTLLATSPVVADTNAAVADCLAPWFGRQSDDAEFLAEIEERFAEIIDTTVVGAAGAEPMLQRLHDAGVSLGIATNDSESSARRQLVSLGWDELFASVMGYDSGHGAKPAPGMVTQSALALGSSPERVAMVGDSIHDIEAGRAAGAAAVYVGRSALLGYRADIWIAEISEIGDLVLGEARS